MKKLLWMIALTLILACLLASCGGGAKEIERVFMNDKGEVILVYTDGTTLNCGKAEQEQSESAVDENPLGLSFFLKDDGTYVAEIGDAKYVSQIEVPAFYNGRAVTEIGSFESENGKNEILTSIIIPNGVTSIHAQAFAGCTSLTSITIPDSVTSIGNSVFNGCTSLASIALGNGITSLDNFQFRSLPSLTSVAIGNGVTSIGYRAFAGCTSLTRIAIPKSVTSIGDYVFDGCTSLAGIYYAGEQEEWLKIDRGFFGVIQARVYFNYVP